MFSKKPSETPLPDARRTDARQLDARQLDARWLQPGFAIPILALLAAVVFFWSLGEAPYWDRDEPRNAGCAAEMLTRGNWIVPTFNSELRGQKPVLLYWLMMASYQMFGVNEFAGRFFSAMLAIGTVVATWGIARSFFDRSIAMLAGCVLATSLMFGVAARAATPDSLLIFCVTVACWIFSNATTAKTTLGREIRNPFENRVAAYSIYAVLGLAILAKGPVGLILPLAVMGWFLLQRRAEFIEPEASKRTSGSILLRATERLAKPFHPANFFRVLYSMRPISGVSLSLAIAAPWFIAVGLATDGEFIRRFFLDENFGRAMNTFENHSGGFWFYPLAILVGFFPWSTFWGPVVADLCGLAFRRNNNNNNGGNENAAELTPAARAGIRLCLCWIAIQVVAFSLVQTKLPSYVTPCYPALAILTSHAIMRHVRQTSFAATWLWKLAHASLILSGITISGAAWFASTQFDFFPTPIALTGLIPVAMGIAGLSQQTKPKLTTQPKHDHRLPAILALGAAAFCVSLLGAGAASIGKQNQLAISSFLQRQDPSVIVASYGCLESSWVYYSEKPILELRTDDPSPSEDTSAYQRQKIFWQPKPRPLVEQLVQSESEIYLITTAELLPELKKRLPEEWYVLQEADWFLRDKTKVLLGRPKHFTQQSTTQSPSSRIAVERSRESTISVTR